MNNDDPLNIVGEKFFIKGFSNTVGLYEFTEYHPGSYQYEIGHEDLLTSTSEFTSYIENNLREGNWVLIRKMRSDKLKQLLDE